MFVCECHSVRFILKKRHVFAVSGQGTELDMAKWAATYYGSNVILGFNEPDHPDQSNIPVSVRCTNAYQAYQAHKLASLAFPVHDEF